MNFSGNALKELEVSISWRLWRRGVIRIVAATSIHRKWLGIWWFCFMV